jgi:hydroxyacylglutathione hydrolase
MRVEIIPCLKDNYAYLLTDGEICAVVDPSEAAPVLATLRDRRLTHILNTHHHADHTGGNRELKKLFGAAVIGPEKDRERIREIDIGVSESAPFFLGKNQVRILEIPAHTRGAIAFVFGDMVFTGDTLFSLGCGRLFEGTPQMMWQSLQKLMQLPDDPRIYCGHEYTLNNGRFALTLEPDNAALVARVKEVEGLRNKNVPTIPSTMGLEKQTNPFLRPDSLQIRKSLGMEKADTVSVFAEIRLRKDVF